MRSYDDILHAIGNTPLVRLNRLTGPKDAAVWVKPEFMNPGGSTAKKASSVGAPLVPLSMSLSKSREKQAKAKSS